MDFELRHQFRIESARFLPRLPKDHPCARMHGHSFLITLRLKGPLDENGWLMDFNEIQERARPIISELDHRVLNDVPGLENPTTELLCKYVYDGLHSRVPGLYQVLISETAPTECRYPFRA